MIWFITTFGVLTFVLVLLLSKLGRFALLLLFFIALTISLIEKNNKE